MVLNKQKAVVVVLGGHRSGTSALASAINSLGVSLGDYLLDKNNDNPKGFFENPKVVALNDRLLEKNGLTWNCLISDNDVDYSDVKYAEFYDEALAILNKYYSTFEYFGLKDPRMCLLMSFWHEALTRFGVNKFHYIICVRNPLESALSQSQRFKEEPQFHTLGKSSEEGLLLWLCYMRGSVRHVTSGGALFSSYENLLNDPKKELNRLARFLDVDVCELSLNKFENNFISQKLKRQSASLLNLEEQVVSMPEIVTIYKMMVELSVSQAQTGDELAELLALFPNRGSFYKHCSGVVQRLYSRASSLAIGKSLELERAGNILRYQECALENSKIEIDNAGRQLKDVQLELSCSQNNQNELHLKNIGLTEDVNNLASKNIELFEFYELVTSGRYWRLRMWLQKLKKKLMKGVCSVR
ncbi:MAG: hypothetical protein ACJA0N_002786 [Pseudohongiellaceae bacterium]|jgi:hypothetical protein